MEKRKEVRPRAGLVLLKDPRLVWVPVVGGQACGVLAHAWDYEEGYVRFFMEVAGEEDTEEFLEVASLPYGILGPRKVLRQALAVLEAALRSPIGTKALVFEPEYWTERTRQGLSFRVLCNACSLQGPHARFMVAVKGWPSDPRPVDVDTLRFPCSCLPDDFNVARNW